MTVMRYLCEICRIASTVESPNCIHAVVILLPREPENNLDFSPSFEEARILTNKRYGDALRKLADG